MTPEGQRIAIAKACGWEITVMPTPSYPHMLGESAEWKCAVPIPNYLNDYTAIIMALRSFPVEIQGEACKLMGCHMDYAIWIDTPPSAMCECLIKALNLWDDSK